MKPPISVALCADKNIEVSLHVTLYSLMNSSRSPIEINLIQKDYSSTDIEKIHKTLKPFSNKYQLNVIEFDETTLFNKYYGLHGNKFNFTKLMLANLLPKDRIIYLDSDLSIGKDLSELFNLDLNNCVIGAASIETIGDSLRSKFYTSIGMKEEARYFNSGVMVMDLKKWRELDITTQCLDWANKYIDRLTFGDEAILNCIFYENFQTINSSYNYPLYPTSDVVASNSENIFHFVGSPKPFDFMGEIVHSNYDVFKKTLVQTSFRNYKSYVNLSVRKLKRTIRLSRSYYNCFAKHIIQRLSKNVRYVSLLEKHI
ncbi:glycosyltransferase family 8 protein [Chamaesiphon minutus]|uniref:LPS:glycosyltransferase n=1 Tax=Chamaesiphon minutus (strain ATCC 27169 / PCC 6605) TaxID=1173020 RepID=K9UK21_CHAP6|nr:glycosyltransferase [Chamaesiphon minutus]AFY94771.1 LPS:glycosyltransferase [Chamaesiphon minutus PCC 6605]